MLLLLPKYISESIGVFAICKFISCKYDITQILSTGILLF